VPDVGSSVLVVQLLSALGLSVPDVSSLLLDVGSSVPDVSSLVLVVWLLSALGSSVPDVGSSVLVRPGAWVAVGDWLVGAGCRLAGAERQLIGAGALLASTGNQRPVCTERDSVVAGAC